MNRRPGSDSHSPLTTVPATSIARVSSFRSPEFELLLYSANVRAESTSWTSSRSIPIYGDHDVVGGRIILGPNCVSGRVVLNISGTFGTKPDTQQGGDGGKHRHIFFSASEIIHVISDSDTPRKGLRQTIMGRSRQSSTMADDAETRTFPFTFNLGRDRRPGENEILPTTIYPLDSKSSAVEVAYKVTATWEPLKLTQKSSLLVIPIIVQPDPDFHSMDGSSWIEIPLKCHRPVPIHCAVTLPKSLTFSRASSIPFFVVFTTTPRSSSLAREVAGDATITVSISSEVCVLEKSNQPIPAQTGTVSNDFIADSRFSRLTSSVFRGLKSRSLSSLHSDSHGTLSTPLPRLSSRKAFSDTQTVYHGISIGFPKRPRHSTSSTKTHPSLDEVRLLPDGLYKGKIPLGRNILTSFNWGGISVKYYFEVSVSLGQDELRAKILLRIT
ncbi:hypothetical protein B0H12DRAFT_1181924 [Mycena haematopus]|nr:hypothetical protein B0H12DRAFT_1181924 [Mycena haematopus]